jgi:hypothetical protein
MITVEGRKADGQRDTLGLKFVDAETDSVIIGTKDSHGNFVPDADVADLDA